MDDRDRRLGPGLSARAHRLSRPSRHRRAASTASTSSGCAPTTASEERIPFGEASYSAGFGGNPEFAPDAYRLHYSSMVTPATVYDYHPGRAPAGDAQGPGDPVRLRSLALRDRAADASGARRQAGAGLDRLPQGLPRRTARASSSSTPTAPTAMPIPPGFSTSRISLLDRGFAYAIAHIRGGDDLGYDWFLDGQARASGPTPSTTSSTSPKA